MYELRTNAATKANAVSGMTSWRDWVEKKCSVEIWYEVGTELERPKENQCPQFPSIGTSPIPTIYLECYLHYGRTTVAIRPESELFAISKQASKQDNTEVEHRQADGLSSKVRHRICSACPVYRRVEVELTRAQ